MEDVLWPRTDAAVVVQAIVVVGVTSLAAVLLRRERALVLLVCGIGAVVIGLMGLRALH